MIVVWVMVGIGTLNVIAGIVALWYYKDPPVYTLIRAAQENDISE